MFRICYTKESAKHLTVSYTFNSPSPFFTKSQAAGFPSMSATMEGGECLSMGTMLILRASRETPSASQTSLETRRSPTPTPRLPCMREIVRVSARAVNVLHRARYYQYPGQHGVHCWIVIVQKHLFNTPLSVSADAQHVLAVRIIQSGEINIFKLDFKRRFL